MEGNAVAALTALMTEFFDFVFECATGILELIVTNPLLIIMIPGVLVVGYVVSWVGKLIRQ